MQLLLIILFAMSANIDNLTVGTAYGIKKIRISNLSNLIIAAISVTGTVLSMSIGLALSKFIPQNLTNLIGDILIIAIGLWFIKDFALKKIIHNSKPSDETRLNRYTEILEKPEKADSDCSGNIDIRETFILAFALTINNLGLGIGASIAGFNIALTAIFTFIFSLGFIWLGYMLGKSFLSKLLGKYASLISGIIIIALGIFELLT